MLYYTNTQPDKPHIAFIGRWSPFHKGHEAIILKKLREQPRNPVLILVRITNTDPYTADMRAFHVMLWMKQRKIRGTIMIIPNIKGVYWGRNVGYHTGLVDVDPSIQNISGSAIRDLIARAKPGWEKHTAHEASAHLLTKPVVSIAQEGFVVWLTGCPSSGKSTISHALKAYLFTHMPYLKTQILDGDTLRASPLGKNVGFTKDERADHIRRMAHLAKMFADQGIFVICAFVSPNRKIRNEAKSRIGRKRFLEVYVKASLKIRIQRDKKGLYLKAKQGKITNLTGYNDPYEEPLKPDIVCDTDKLDKVQCVQQIVKKIFT